MTWSLMRLWEATDSSWSLLNHAWCCPKPFAQLPRYPEKCFPRVFVLVFIECCSLYQLIVVRPYHFQKLVDFPLSIQEIPSWFRRRLNSFEKAAHTSDFVDFSDLNFDETLPCRHAWISLHTAVEELHKDFSEWLLSLVRVILRSIYTLRTPSWRIKGVIKEEEPISSHFGLLGPIPFRELHFFVGIIQFLRFNVAIPENIMSSANQRNQSRKYLF